MTSTGVDIWPTDALPDDASVFPDLSTLTANSLELRYRDTATQQQVDAIYKLTALRSSIVSGAAPVSAGDGVGGDVLGGSGSPGGISATFDTSTGGTFFATEVAPGTTDDFQTRVGPFHLDSYEVDFTGDLLGPVTLTFGYADDPFGVGPVLKDRVEEAALRVYHREDAASPWEELASIVDSANNTITVTTTSLSPFVLGGEILSPAPVPSLGAGGLVMLALGFQAIWLIRARRSRVV